VPDLATASILTKDDGRNTEETQTCWMTEVHCLRRHVVLRYASASRDLRWLGLLVPAFHNHQATPWLRLCVPLIFLAFFSVKSHYARPNGNRPLRKPSLAQDKSDPHE